MLLITQPTQQTEEHDAKCHVSGPEWPGLEKEPPPPELMEESSYAVLTEIKYSNIPRVLMRKSTIPHDQIDIVLSGNEIISDSVVSERNTADVIVIKEIPPIVEGSIQKLREGSSNQETQVEHAE
jgi:hypothetical protein